MTVPGGTYDRNRYHGPELHEAGGSDRDSNWSEERELVEVIDSVRLGERFAAKKGFRRRGANI
jgi:hypothetical protein